MTGNLFKRTGAEDFPTKLKVMVSGPPKSGKTTLLGTIPNLIVLDTEPNANNLASIAHLDVPYVTITNTDDLRQVAFMLKDPTLRKQVAAQYGWTDVGGVAIDTLDSLQKIMKVERMKEQRSTTFARDDWGWLKTEMEAIVEMFTSLPMHTIFTMHTKTKEMGKGDDSYTIVLPGLEGSIAESIAGMVGYSMLAYRDEQIAADGSKYTAYWLQTEGDATHDFLGTRTAGRLPTIIEPNMKTLYDAVMAGRPKKAAIPVDDVPLPDATEEVAQSPGQPDEPMEALEASVAVMTEAPVAKPADEEPVNLAAMTHVKKVYDAIGQAFPEEKVQAMKIGAARELVKVWRAIQQDSAEGKTQDPNSEMLAYLNGLDLLAEQGVEKETAPTAATPSLDGTIDAVRAYVGDDLTLAQEAYEKELAREKPRSSLITWLENMGVKVQTSVETTGPEQPVETVTQPSGTADAEPTEEQAVETLKETLGAERIIEKDVTPCEACGDPIDDEDLAQLGLKRFDKVYCVKDYLAQIRK